MKINETLVTSTVTKYLRAKSGGGSTRHFGASAHAASCAQVSAGVASGFCFLPRDCGEGWDGLARARALRLAIIAQVGEVGADY